MWMIDFSWLFFFEYLFMPTIQIVIYTGKLVYDSAQLFTGSVNSNQIRSVWLCCTLSTQNIVL